MGLGMGQGVEVGRLPNGANVHTGTCCNTGLDVHLGSCRDRACSMCGSFHGAQQRGHVWRCMIGVGMGLGVEV